MLPKNYQNAQTSLITRDMREITGKTGNNYMSVAIIAKRSRQVAANMKDELAERLSDFTAPVDNLEEMFENREQIEISKFYERLPKPTLIATEEFLENKIEWRFPEEDTNTPNTTL